MSSGAHVAVLSPGRTARAVETSPSRHRESLTLAAFAALGLYGLMRWATLLQSPPVARLLGLLVLAVVVAGLGSLARSRSRAVQLAAVTGVYACTLAVFPISGFPLHWVLHFEVARTLNAVSTGTDTLPNVIVPYGFAHLWTRDVIVLGAGLLLLVGGLTLASIRSSAGEIRLAAAALPLVVLAIVPSTLSTPRLPYVHGAVLFMLLAALLFSRRVPAGRELLAGSAVLLATIGAMAAAPTLGRPAAWISIDSLAGTNGSGRHTEAFNWNQTYGPLSWPHRGTVVLDVRAADPYYWKAEDLDLFDGSRWRQASTGPGPEDAQSTVPQRTQDRWSQTLTVSFRAIDSTQVIAAGYAFEPVASGGQETPIENLEAGAVPGTWATTVPLQPGNTYQIRAYTPTPSPAQLRRAGTRYPLPALQGELEMFPPQRGAGDPTSVVSPA
jgi:hypothetical protein